MKTKIYQIVILFILSQVFISCRNEPKSSQKNVAPTEKQETKQVNEFGLLVDYLEKNGDYINSAYCPAMIDAKKVYENLNNVSSI